MKCIILLGFLALSYSLPFQSRHVDIGDDGTITITEPTGKKIIISKSLDHYGKKNIDISITGSNTIPKRILIDEANHLKTAQIGDQEYEYAIRDKRSNKKVSQSEILTEIFKDYQGVVDEKTYDKILKKVNKAVESGEVNPIILAILEDKRQLEGADSRDSLDTSVERKPYEIEGQKAYPKGAQKPYDVTIPLNYDGIYGKSVPVHFPQLTHGIGYPRTYFPSEFSYHQQPLTHYPNPHYLHYPIQERIPLEGKDYERELILQRYLQQHQGYIPSYSSYHGYTYNPYQEYLLRRELGQTHNFPSLPQTGYSGLKHPYYPSTSVIH